MLPTNIGEKAFAMQVRKASGETFGPIPTMVLRDDGEKEKK